MRELTTRFNPTRSSSGKNKYSKYIFAFEGFNTEFEYFNGIINNRGIARIRSLVDICILQRENVDSGCSDPMGVLENVRCYTNAMKSGHHDGYTVSGYLKGLISSITDKGRKDVVMDEVDKLLCEELEDLMNGKVVDKSKIEEKCMDIVEQLTGEKYEITLPELGSYDPQIDHVCVIVDRDKDSHSKGEIESFITKCQDYGFIPVICNPCFELWLMLHFDSIKTVDSKLLSENPIINGKRFTEIELDRIVNELNSSYHYDKTKLDPHMFLHRIGDAVVNSKLFCENIRWLEQNVGTNLGIVFEPMINK